MEHPNEKLVLDALMGACAVTAIGLGTHELVEMSKSKELSEMLLNSDAEVQIVDVKNDSVTFKQNEREVTVKNQRLSEVVRKRLIEKFPQYKDFLEAGAINVIKTESKE